MIKRILDFVAALVGLIIFSPILLAVAIWIKLDSPGPVFYRGQRAGKNGKPFRIFKFRSMVTNADKIGGPSTSDRDPRITKSGAFVRKFKLDELPQFINVLVGDMSFVGPRPEVQKYVDMYTAEEKPILDLRPGITDWASIWNSDEGAVLAKYPDPDKAYEEVIRPGKLQLQLRYRYRNNPWIDLKILFYTAYRIINRDFYPTELNDMPRLLPASNAVVQMAEESQTANLP
ncbi:MAG: sugar transferase [Armatimonadetes bacterium]|nr:sugar transferase [Armatimonadota bacterium]